MTRKDSEKDTDRPHYYSQFWLDVAAGRAVIGASKVEEEAEPAEAELEMPEPEPLPLRKAVRNSMTSVSDGYKATQPQTVAEPDFAPQEFAETEENEFELANNVDDMELPNIVLDEMEEDTTIPELDRVPDEEEMEEEEEEEEEELFYDEEEEEEEDEDSWSARGRKKPKPGRQVKQPKLPKKPKREPRRGF